ncbi:unnamed protein product [Sphagnum jensenii]|uniref:Uncharacterized protein n=1 Tax=Sphagnum jensenii TaxID=128206 RepID=A0ABP1B831_9BRYO
MQLTIVYVVIVTDKEDLDFMRDIFLTPLVYTYFGNVACRSLICYFTPCLVPVQAFGSLICYFTSVWNIEWLLNQHAFPPLFPFPLLDSNIFCIF